MKFLEWLFDLFTQKNRLFLSNSYLLFPTSFLYMDFFYKNNTLSIESDKKVIQCLPNQVNLDGLSLEMAGEYEKWGFLAYAYEENESRIFQITIEWYHVGYISETLTDLSSAALDFLGDLDILVMPTGKGSVALIEKIEPRLVVTYGEAAHELATHMGISEPPVAKYRLKDADLSLDKAGCVVMGE